MLQVLWQLDSGHKTFLPRLGGGLTSITRSSVDAACYVISQADNTVRMVSTAAWPCFEQPHDRLHLICTAWPL